MKTKWHARYGAAANARHRLPGLASEYFAAGRALAAIPDATPDEMHAFRLATKRWRYTLELFRSCYGPGLDRRLDELKKVQTFLGDLNDCAVAARLAAGAIEAANPARQRFEEFLARRSSELTAAFRDHWASVFDAPRRESAWRAYLGRAA